VTKYEHTQIGYVILWALLAVAAFFTVGAAFASSSHPGTTLIVSIALLITLVLFYKLTITIDDESLCVSLGIGIIHKRVPVAEIVACEPVHIRWWYGWGVHLTPYGWLYNVSGVDVAITLGNGRKFALGTNDPHGLASAIQASIR
jgi:hypothetical protein